MVPCAMQEYVGATEDFDVAGGFRRAHHSHFVANRRVEPDSMSVPAVRAFAEQLGTLFGCTHKAGYFHTDAHIEADSINNLQLLRNI